MKLTLKDQTIAFEDACRGKGLRLTPQRAEIFKVLVKATDHPSAETLHQRLLKQMPTLSLDTVYRTLRTFAKLGLINKVETVESQARFEAFHSQHHHLICEKCQEIMDFHWPDIDEASLPEGLCNWGRINRKSLVVYGTCQKCLSKLSEP